MKKTLHNKKGFTLAELLIVVAIIAVLVAIAIPIFTSQLEKARDSADAANLRAQYAETAVKVLESGTDVTSTGVKITGKTPGFGDIEDIGGVSIKNNTTLNAAKSPQIITVTVHADGTAPEFKVNP